MADNAVLARDTNWAPKNAASSQTVAFSHYNNLSAQLPINPKTGNMVAGGAKAQAEQCMKNLAAVLDSIGHVMDDTVRLTVMVKNIKDIDAVDEVLGACFANLYKPVRTSYAVADLAMGASVQIEALVSNGEGSMPFAPQPSDVARGLRAVDRNTNNAPMNALSTQTVAFSHYNNLSAQIGLDASGKMIAGGVKEQAEQCFKNIKTILEDIDHVMDHIVRITIFAKSLADIETAKEVYKTFFPGYVPALTTVCVAGLPQDALVQVEAVVSHGDGTPPQPIADTVKLVIEANNTDKAPKSPLSTQTAAFSHYNHISAQLPVDTNVGVKEQAAQCLQQIKDIVESIDHVMADAVKINIALKNIADLPAVDEAYATFFPGGVPARRVIGVSDLPAGALIQIDAVFGNVEGTPPN
jgi:reactive intermediate/imine deaminase